MKRPLKPDDLRIWGLVAATVHPLPGRATFPSPSGEGGERSETAGEARGPSAAPEDQPVTGRGVPSPRSPTRPSLRSGHPPAEREGKDPIEPNRRHRIARERDPIGARLDLHGLTYDQARSRLERFLAQAWDEGYRAVLVITGKGVQGDGVLRRATPEWLAAPHLAHIVAGVSEAHRRHGGEGALYVALKRKPRG
jgi:DNA-nicking Smr family endonuclease